MPKGGARKGAGRKKGGKNAKTLEKDAIRELFREKILERWDDVLGAALELAVGVQVEKTNPVTKKAVVYQKAPNSDMLKYVLDQLIDKPIQRIIDETPKEDDPTLTAEDRKKKRTALQHGFAQQNTTSDHQADTE